MPTPTTHGRMIARSSQSAFLAMPRHLIDLGLLSTLMLTPLALGGRHDMGRLVFAISVAIAVVATAWQAAIDGRGWRIPRLPLAILCAAIAVVMIQVIPLPISWIGAAAPGHGDLLPLWSQASPLGEWKTLSLAPSETVEGLALLLLNGALFFVVFQRVQSAEDARRLTAWIGVSALVVAGVAVAKVVFSTDRLLWLYDVPQWSFNRGLQGSFANRNHFAHFALLGAFAWLPSVITRSRGDFSSKPYQWTTALRVMAIGLLLVISLATRSRGAALGLAAAITTCVVIRCIISGISRRDIIAALCGLALILGGLSFFDYDGVTGRLDDLVTGDLEELDPAAGRRLIWSANIAALQANPWFGHGVGTHRLVYPAYIQGSHPRDFTHAESSYLQIASETGAAGLMILAMALVVAVLSVLRNALRATTPEDKAFHTGCLGVLGLSLVHSVVDFIWFLPALIAPVIIYVACDWRLAKLRAFDSEVVSGSSSSNLKNLGRRPIYSIRKLIPSLAIACAAAFSVTILWPPAAGSLAADRYARAVRTNRALMKQHFEAGDGKAVVQLESSIIEVSRRALRELREFVRLDPRNGVARTKLAAALMAEFEKQISGQGNAMSIEMINDTVTTNEFTTTSGLNAWLNRAFGDPVSLLNEAVQHAEAAIHLAPLQADPYLHLAKLSFLRQGGYDASKLIDQSIWVRPFDGGVHYAAGRQLHARGQFENAMQHYRRSLHCSGPHRAQLIDTMARFLPAEQLIQSLEPNAEVIPLLLTAYQQTGSREDLETIADYAEHEALRSLDEQNTRRAANCWRQMSAVNRTLDRPMEAIRCARVAYELLPNDFWIRYEIAAALVAADSFDEADPHIRWCLSRRPDLQPLHHWIRAGARHRALASRTHGILLPQSRTGVATSLSHDQNVNDRVDSVPFEVITEPIQ